VHADGVIGDGNGWVGCAAGHRHWGRHGAAGLLVRHVDRAGTPHVLLQHRAAWSHHGSTWGIPGGARDSHETPEQAALREADEECGLAADRLLLRGSWTDDHGGWIYVTVLAEAHEMAPVAAGNFETVELRWVPIDRVDALPLHPGFAASWPRLRAL
jgi:8-oxo-dGTP pyrophosphatase MutT (NUDIX family)